jgi:hypothetical protein
MTGENGLFGHGTSLGRIPLLRPARDGDFPQACSSIIARRSVRSRVTRPASFSRAPWRTTGSPRQSADAMRPSSSAKPRAVRAWRILTPPARSGARSPSPRPPAGGWGCGRRAPGARSVWRLRRWGLAKVVLQRIVVPYATLTSPESAGNGLYCPFSWNGVYQDRSGCWTEGLLSPRFADCKRELVKSWKQRLVPVRSAANRQICANSLSATCVALPFCSVCG